MTRVLGLNRSRAFWAALAACSMTGSALAASASAEVIPHTSETMLPSSNGRGAIAWNASTFRITQFLEHAYQNRTSTSASRQFVYDSYPGVRIGTTGTWLSAVQPVKVEYLPGTGIIHVVRTLSGYAFDEYDFAPMGLGENASVMLVTVTNESGASAVDVYSLFNYQVGSPISGSIQPGNDNETIAYDSSNGAYYETGPSAVAFAFIPIGGPATHHGSSAGSSPTNPYKLLGSGANLADDTGTGAAVTAAVAGFQNAIGTLTTGASATVGWITILDPSGNGSAAAGRVASWVAGRSASKLLADEVAGWAAWQTPAPPGASTFEAQVAAQAQVMIRMGQVTEAAPSGGQILASIAPGEWNISWVRDMAYSTVALARTGHFAEAKAALAFELGATTNSYEAEVGKPYQISVCRYYGNGTEQSDSNSDGPNIEFDGFGLFLWALDEYITASGDTTTLATWWPTVKSMVADVLVSLQDPSTGLIAADSSIWEAHWDGQQKHFAYTTIAAANGLCAAARLASAAGDATDVSTYNSAGTAARDAILHSLRGADGAIAQSLEGLAAGSGWIDGATVEAFNFGLFDPTRGTARATMQAIEANLVPPSGRGFMRDQGGSTYDSSEWVFIDLRMQRAMELHGETANQVALFDWNTEQAIDNYGELSELHDPVTANYTGASPMVGFGAGAYLIALAERGTPLVPTCGAFASEPPLVTDAGDDATAPVDAGEDAPPAPDATAPDAAPPVDAATDAGPTGTAPRDSGTPIDSGAGDGGTWYSNYDAGGPATVSSSSSCSCTTAGAKPDGAPFEIVAVGTLVAAMRKRGRRGEE